MSALRFNVVRPPLPRAAKVAAPRPGSPLRALRSKFSSAIVGDRRGSSGNRQVFQVFRVYSGVFAGVLPWGCLGGLWVALAGAGEGNPQDKSSPRRLEKPRFSQANPVPRASQGPPRQTMASPRVPSFGFASLFWVGHFVGVNKVVWSYSLGVSFLRDLGPLPRVNAPAFPWGGPRWARVGRGGRGGWVFNPIGSDGIRSFSLGCPGFFARPLSSEAAGEFP